MARWLTGVEPTPSVPYATAWAFRWRDRRAAISEE
jgi:hypothetical protein